MTTRIMFGYLAVVAVGELSKINFCCCCSLCFFPHIVALAGKQSYESSPVECD